MKKTFLNILSSKLAQNSMWLILLKIFNTIIPVLTLPYITRILSKSSYGEFSIALTWVTYLQVFVEFGFGYSGAKSIATRQNDNEINQKFSNIIYSRLFLFFISLTIWGLLIVFTPISKNQIICMTILLIMALSTVFQQTWFFQGMSEMKNIAIINIASRLVSVILIFLFVKQPSDLYLYCFLYVSTYLISGFVGCAIVMKNYKVRFTRLNFSNIICEIRTGWTLFIPIAMSTIFSNIGISLLGIFSTASMAGAYSAISKIPYVLTILFSSISQALYPQSCRAFSENYNKGLRFIKSIGIPVCAFFIICGAIIILFSRAIVTIAFGTDYATDSLLLIPLMIWQILGIANNFLGIQILVASGHQKEYSFSFTISMTLMIVFMLLLCPHLTAYGIAVSSMLSELILSILLGYYIQRIRKSLLKGENNDKISD